MAKQANQSKFGTKAEKKVADQLRRAGAKVERSPGSRGAADLKAEFPAKTWDVQVKSSRTNEAAELTAQERTRLNRKASQDGATPVLAQVTPEGVEFKSTRSGRRLTPKTKAKK
ncbi:MAG: hypothetical protein IID37_07590 [Planctomycetes bacterium]|nr:hypothetical protein [Planctomycetota bacterium]